MHVAAILSPIPRGAGDSLRIDQFVAVGSAALNIAIAAFTSAFVTGLFLIGGYFYSRRVEKQKGFEQQWTAIGIPVLNAADDLVARMFDVLVRDKALNMKKDLTESVSIFDPDRALSTVWRLLQYLAAAAGLDRSSFEGGGKAKLDNLRLYVGKARIALKGNVFGSATRIQTEAQEAIGAKVLSLGRPGRTDPSDFYEFASRLPADLELKQCVQYVAGVFDLPAAANPDPSKSLTLAHFCVYLIDCIQDLRPTSKWEEFRIYLVTLIRAHNRSTQKAAVYFYRPGDLMTEDYRDTYAYIASDGFKGVLRSWRLSARARSGFSRELSRNGVTRKHGPSALVLNYKQAPGDILATLRTVFHV